jgi:hypothetical protein
MDEFEKLKRFAAEIDPADFMVASPFMRGCRRASVGVFSSCRLDLPDST